uniref:Polyprenol dehydrogenase n=1 Tax=Geotrypetes seraphini TaxID=260995 RepID=A0A6P8RGK2_GEOSA|nr:zinc finger BED domain-containing protein 1 isoform X3 [Geotrypetes seraphini]
MFSLSLRRVSTADGRGRLACDSSQAPACREDRGEPSASGRNCGAAARVSAGGCETAPQRRLSRGGEEAARALSRATLLRLPCPLWAAARTAMSLLSATLLPPLLRVYAAGVWALLAQLFSRRFALPAFPSQHGKVAVITGGAKGMGYCTSRHLSRLGMHVIIAGNNEREGQEAVRTIREETLNEKVEFIHCDLASMKSIRNFVLQFKAKNLPLHVLINNAGVMLVPKRMTEDGFEEHFGLNYLGHFLLTNLFVEMLKESGRQDCSARVVTVSSATHYVGELRLDELQNSCYYSSHGAYAQSKLALVLFTYQLQHHLTATRCPVTANAVDPGVVNTELYKNLNWAGKVIKWMTAWFFFKTPEEGAATAIFAAASPELEGVGGCYLYNGERTRSADISYDEDLQRKLWAVSCKMTGVHGAASSRLEN